MESRLNNLTLQKIHQALIEQRKSTAKALAYLGIEDFTAFEKLLSRYSFEGR